MQKKQLVRTAKELNKTLGLDPQIDTKLEPGELSVEILKAADLLVPEDDITQDTKNVIEALKAEKDKPAAPADGEGSEASGEANDSAKPSNVQRIPRDPSKPTKKSVVEDMLKAGATIEQMAQKIVDLEIDPDYNKNRKIVKLWLSKMGYDVKKASIDANPIFKSKE